MASVEWLNQSKADTTYFKWNLKNVINTLFLSILHKHSMRRWRQWVKQIGHKLKWDNVEEWDVEILNEKYDDESHVKYSYCMKSKNSTYNFKIGVVFQRQAPVMKCRHSSLLMIMTMQHTEYIRWWCIQFYDFLCVLFTWNETPNAVHRIHVLVHCVAVAVAVNCLSSKCKHLRSWETEIARNVYILNMFQDQNISVKKARWCFSTWKIECQNVNLSFEANLKRKWLIFGVKPFQT